jgi:hypothetical protein
MGWPEFIAGGIIVAIGVLRITYFLSRLFNNEY